MQPTDVAVNTNQTITAASAQDVLIRTVARGACVGEIDSFEGSQFGGFHSERADCCARKKPSVNIHEAQMRQQVQTVNRG